MQIPTRVKDTSAKSNPLFQKDELAPVITINASEDSYVEPNKDLKVIDEKLQASIMRKIGSKIFVDNAAIDSFYVGQILISDITDDAPYGFLVKVESIEKNQDYSILNVKDASIDDAFDSANIRLSNNQCADNCDEATFDNYGDAIPDNVSKEDCLVISLNGYLPRRGEGEEVDFEDFDCWADADINSRCESSGSSRWWFYAQPSANLVIAFDFIKNVEGLNDRVEVGVGLQLPSIAGAEACGNPGTDPDITLGFETMYTKTWRYPAQVKNLPRIRIWVSGVPITFKNKGGFGGTATIEGSMKAALNVDLFGTFMHGASIEKDDNGNWKGIENLGANHFQDKYGVKKPGWSIVQSGFYFGAGFEFWPYLQIETRLWGVAGIIGKVGPSFDSNINMCASYNEQNVTVNVAGNIGVSTEMSAVLLSWESGVRRDYFGPFGTFDIPIPLYSRTESDEDVLAGDCNLHVPEPIDEEETTNPNNESRISYNYVPLGSKKVGDNEKPSFQANGVLFYVSPKIGTDGSGFTITRSGAGNNNKKLAYSNGFKFLNWATTFHLRHGGANQYQITLDDPDDENIRTHTYLRVNGNNAGNYTLSTTDRKADADIFTITNLRNVKPLTDETPLPSCRTGKRDISESDGTVRSSNLVANVIQDFYDYLEGEGMCRLMGKLEALNDDNISEAFRDDFCSRFVQEGKCTTTYSDLQNFDSNRVMVDAWDLVRMATTNTSKKRLSLVHQALNL